MTGSLFHNRKVTARSQFVNVTLSRRRHVGEAANELTRGLADQYVDIYKFADGRLEVRWKRVFLPYHSFNKDQRVTHASIVENKRLSEALSFVKRLQEQQQKPITVKTNSERVGYQRTGRKLRDRSDVGSGVN